MNMIDNPNKRIIAGIKAGEGSALDECISAYGHYVAYIADNIIGKALPNEDKEEVIADVFITIWKYRNRLDVNQSDSFKSLIGTIARNLSKNKLRDSGHYLTSEELSVDFKDKVDVENDVIKNDLEKKILDCVSNFKKEDRICFIHHYYYHKKIKDIAKELGLTESAVKSKLKRGRDKIREALGREVMENDI